MSKRKKYTGMHPRYNRSWGAQAFGDLVVEPLREPIRKFVVEPIRKHWAKVSVAIAIILVACVVFVAVSLLSWLHSF